MFADDQVDIVYIATPHNTHIQYLREALKAGKHVLCEKAVTLNTEELKEARQLAEKQDIVLAEAMTIYHMPLYKKLQEVVADGKLGKLQMIQVSFGSYKEYNMSNRFLIRHWQEELCWTLVSMPLHLPGYFVSGAGSDFIQGEDCTEWC